MDRIDGKGHHPKIRVKHWTDKIRSKRRTRSVLPATKQLFMLQTQTAFVTMTVDYYGFGIGNVADAQVCTAETSVSSTTMIEDVGCSDAGIWYVDSKGCGMQQATPSNSPPKIGFVRTAMRYVASGLLIVLMAFLSGCQKDPAPQPIEPTREIVLDWDWTRPSLWTRSNVVESYATQPDVKSIEIKFIPANTSGYGVNAFSLARDSLDLCASKNPDIITWTGTIVVGADGASLPSDVTGAKCGMREVDSARFAQFGANIIRYHDWNGRSK